MNTSILSYPATPIANSNSLLWAKNAQHIKCQSGNMKVIPSDSGNGQPMDMSGKPSTYQIRQGWQLKVWLWVSSISSSITHDKYMPHKPFSLQTTYRCQHRTNKSFIHINTILPFLHRMALLTSSPILRCLVYSLVFSAFL